MTAPDTTAEELWLAERVPAMRKECPKTYHEGRYLGQDAYYPRRWLCVGGRSVVAERHTPKDDLGPCDLCAGRGWVPDCTLEKMLDECGGATFNRDIQTGIWYATYQAEFEPGATPREALLRALCNAKGYAPTPAPTDGPRRAG